MNATNEALTVQEFVRSFEKLKRPLSLPESEDSWEQIYKGFDQLGRLCQRGAFEHTLEFISSLRSIHRNVVGAMNSERTRLSGVALDLLGTVASGLSSDFEPLLPLFFPSLLSLCARTNKVVVSRAKICIVTIVEVTQLPSILIYLAQSAKDKSPSVRLVVTEVTLSCLKCFNPPDLEKENLSSTIEAIIRSSARDANAEIRKVGKDIFQSYKVLLPDRVESFAAPLTPTIRKYLQLSAGNSRPNSRAALTGVSTSKAAARSATTTSKQQSNMTSGPVRPTKSSTITSRPTAPTRPLQPLRSIQVPTKLGDGPTTTGPIQRKPPTIVSHPFVLDRNATGPQRVIKPSTTPMEGPSAPPVERRVIKAPLTRPAGPARSRVASGSEPAHSTSSQTVPAALKQMQTRKVQATAKPPADSDVSALSRDLTRPTLSQLARIRPPVTRSVTVRGLEIRKAQVSVNPALKGPGQTSESARARVAQTSVGPTKFSRPITPAMIALPPSPKLPLAEPSESTPEPSNEKILEGPPMPTSDAEVIVVQENDMASTRPVVTVENNGSTPVLNDGRITDVNLALKTPISALLSSIQQGFDLTPCSPLSPPQDYLASSNSPVGTGPFKLGIIRQNVVAPAQP